MSIGAIIMASVSALSCSPPATSPSAGLDLSVSLVNYAPSWSPDGSLIAFTHAAQTVDETALGNAQVWLCRVQTGEVEYVTSGAAPDWSPDGTMLAYIRSQDVWTVDLLTRSPSKLIDCELCGRPQWSPDGATIMYRSQTREGDTMWFVNGDGTNPRNAGIHMNSADWSPSGQHIAMATVDEESILILELGTSGDSRKLVSGAPDHVRLPRWSPDGLAIAYFRYGQGGTSPSTGTWLAHIDGGMSYKLLSSGRMADWSPDGSELVYERVDEEAQQVDLWLFDRATGQSRPLLGAPIGAH